MNTHNVHVTAVHHPTPGAGVPRRETTALASWAFQFLRNEKYPKQRGT
jgi:hypothetical protein